MKRLPIELKKVGEYFWFVRLMALGLAIWMTIFSPMQAVAQSAQSSVDQPVRNTTDSDLSDIPNLEQMDYDKFKHYFGEVPVDRKPLFNPDNTRSQTIEDKDPRSGQVIVPADLQERRTDAESPQ